MPTRPDYGACALSALSALPGDDDRGVAGQVGLEDRQPVKGPVAEPADDVPAVYGVGQEQVLAAGVSGQPDLPGRPAEPLSSRDPVVDALRGSIGRDVLDGELRPEAVP